MSDSERRAAGGLPAALSFRTGNAMGEAYDILGLGCATMDDFLFVREYPPAESKVRVTRRERQGGGLTGTALVAAARLGARCAYAGILGRDDEVSRFLRATFEREGIDARHAAVREDASPLHSFNVVDETHETRTCFYYTSGAAGADERAPSEDVIRSAKVLFVDQYGVPGMLRAATVAREAGIEVVADFEHGDVPRFGELVALVGHLILPMNFARELTDLSDPEAVVRALWIKGMDTVAVTHGREGAWFIHRDDPRTVRRQSAFLVHTVDTTGCGDVFHGAYAAALARGLPVEQRMRLASAAAAIKSTQPGGQKGIPTLPVVEKFLAERGG